MLLQMAILFLLLTHHKRNRQSNAIANTNSNTYKNKYKNTANYNSSILNTYATVSASSSM